MAARHWTAEQKMRQSAIIHQWQPWTKSTGARTQEGKTISSRNVLVGIANRKKALDQAYQELEVAEAKIRQLTSMGRRSSI